MFQHAIVFRQEPSAPMLRCRSCRVAVVPLTAVIHRCDRFVCIELVDSLMEVFSAAHRNGNRTADIKCSGSERRKCDRKLGHINPGFARFQCPGCAAQVDCSIIQLIASRID
jgi:hypothetical protein